MTFWRLDWILALCVLALPVLAHDIDLHIVRTQ